jgi:hypothetical protein
MPRMRAGTSARAHQAGLLSSAMWQTCRAGARVSGKAADAESKRRVAICVDSPCTGSNLGTCVQSAHMPHRTLALLGSRGDQHDMVHHACGCSTRLAQE